MLITLGIIGIVAALTMPALVANYQKQQTVTQLKKAYAILVNGFKLAEAEDVILPQDGDCSSITPDDFLDTYIKPYFKVIKTCTEADGNNCGYPAGHTWISPDGTSRNMGMYTFAIDHTRAGITLNDGTFVLFRYKNSDGISCHLTLFLDLNGPKAPNMLGKDVFGLYNDRSTANVLRPFGNDESVRGCYKGGWGYACLHKIIQDGWEIKEDYPW